MKRCPFLKGQLYKRQFKSKLSDGRDAEFDFECHIRGTFFNLSASFVHEYGCFDGNFERCEDYVHERFKLTSGLPLVCPCYSLESHNCTVQDASGECSLFELDLEPFLVDNVGYLSCSEFSRWFFTTHPRPLERKGRKRKNG